MEIREVENNFNCTASPYPTNIMSVILLPQVKMGVQINKQQQKLSMNQKDQKDQNEENQIITIGVYGTLPYQEEARQKEL